MSIRRVGEEEHYEPINFDGDLDEVLADVIDERGLTLAGDKTDTDGLNDVGRKSLNKNGATLDESSKVLKHLLYSDDDKVRLQAAKFVHERHSGRLEGNKEDRTPKIVFNIGGGVTLDPALPSFLNPRPKLIEQGQDGNTV